MKRISIVIMLFIPFLTLMGCNNNNKNMDKDIKIEAGTMNNAPADKAFDFKLKTIDGKTIKLSNFKGKVVIVDFWATWCGPCRKGIPDLISLQNQYKNNLVVIGISVDKQTAKDVPSFIKSNHMNYYVAMATDEVVKKYGGLEGIPTSFVIDKKGFIVEKYVGLQEKSTYEDLIKKLK